MSTPSVLTPNQVLEVMEIFADADAHSELWWRFDQGQIRVFAQCSDLFDWATADCEPITADDIPALRQTLADLQHAENDSWPLWFPDLWCARKRGMRPQEPVLGRIKNAEVKMLFLACCTDEARAQHDRETAAFWATVAHNLKEGRREQSQ